MYSVSESYKNALLQKHITDTVEGTVLLKDGTEIKLNDSTVVTGSLRIIHELCDDYKIGTFNLGSLHIGFFDDGALLRDFSGAKITLTYKIETENGWESVPLGIFIADGQSVVRRRSTVTLTAYDYGILFDCTLGTTIRNMSGTAEEIISAACERCGVSFGGLAEGLPNTSVVASPLSKQIQSCRDLVGWCAALLCGYAVIDREGKLKIISARYAVEADDPSEIIVDKYLTSAERDSIYSTDTRAWIAQMSAYSAGEVKIYRSGITQDDVQAARAIYYLEKNPLTEGMSESACDEINCEWLSFIDGFKQRGITAELYGDPALDVGDILRCSEGDIDQRSSVVGLVTKQEWRYRNYHTVICASAQLADGFPENEEEESASEAEAVGETDTLYPVKVIAQSEKKASDGGKEYYAGQGLSLTDGNAFQLNFASQSTRGGMYMAVGEWVAEGDETADYGIYMGSEHLGALRTATRYQKGGFFLGDGLVPVLEERENSSGETVYSASDYVELRLGEGLYFIDKDEAETDTKEKRRNHYGGRAVAVSRATTEQFGIVKLGKRLGIDTDGSAYVALFAGDGIDIDDSGVITVKIDNETITADDEGKLKAAGGVSIENAIVIKEEDAKLLLHEYTEVEYIAGNKIVYGGHGNPVIASGLVCWLYNNASANGIVANTVNNAASADNLPDVPVYQSVSFSTPAYIRGTAAVSNVDKITVELTEYYTDYAKFCTYAWSGETKTQISTDTIWNGAELGICFLFTGILAPGTYQGMEFPYGAVKAYPFWKYARGASSFYFSGFAYDNYIPFASEAEYNAAVQLTTEPQTLTEVQETVTEV